MNRYILPRTFAQIIAFIWGSFEIGTWICPRLAILGPDILSWMAYIGIGATVLLGLLAIDLYVSKLRLTA